MATTKSTVVGIRLDHDRRAWVEAEAARRGVSVRGLFEEMIDGARTGEAEAARAIAGLGSATHTVVEDHPVERFSEVPRGGEAEAPGWAGSVNTASSSSHSPRSGSASRSGFGPVSELPQAAIRGALSLATGVMKASGRCALGRVERCPLTRLLTER